MTQVCNDSPYPAEIAELKSFIKKERDARQVKKALAVKLVYQGYEHELIVPSSGADLLVPVCKQLSQRSSFM